MAERSIGIQITIREFKFKFKFFIHSDNIQDTSATRGISYKIFYIMMDITNLEQGVKPLINFFKVFY